MLVGETRPSRHSNREATQTVAQQLNELHHKSIHNMLSKLRP